MERIFFVLFFAILMPSIDCRIDKNLEGFMPATIDFKSSTELALSHCQESFKWEKWNCPSKSFHIKSTSNIIDREQAFVTAITSASQLFTRYINCTRQFSPECESLASQDFETGDYKTRDLKLFAILHNSRAGKLAIRNSLRELCRCHGMSGSCSLQTCWKSMNAFSVISEVIKRMYDNSVIVQLDNFGRIDEKNIQEDQLVYITESPNYCHPNVIPKWKGMKNRQCSKGNHQKATRSEKLSCKNLCKSCGLNVAKRSRKVQQKCNFKFDWKTSITFDICEEVVSEYYCN